MKLTLGADMITVEIILWPEFLRQSFYDEKHEICDIRYLWKSAEEALKWYSINSKHSFFTLKCIFPFAQKKNYIETPTKSAYMYTISA